MSRRNAAFCAAIRRTASAAAPGGVEFCAGSVLGVFMLMAPTYGVSWRRQHEWRTISGPMRMAERRGLGKGSAYHHGDLKTALRVEAERILVERGIAEVGLREVARALGVSHNAPYRHFANREALLAEIAAGGFQRLGALYEEAIAPEDPTARVTAIGHMYLRFALAEPAVFRLMMGKDLAKPQYVELKAAADGVFAMVRAGVLTAGVPEPAVAETLALWSMVHGIATLLLDDRIEGHGGPIDPFEVVTTFTATFMVGVRANASRS
ncbi:TetR/AcrR family transcriptional regulator [Methylobacterium sp. WL8]|nr:TetR/AcrR family transcriptional regulator [Methylobacterium sp. WL122]TXN79205.1 TetR/AcrR family transcriptional regulator [Methylobacterium sp. WL8]